MTGMLTSDHLRQEIESVPLQLPFFNYVLSLKI